MDYLAQACIPLNLRLAASNAALAATNARIEYQVALAEYINAETRNKGERYTLKDEAYSRWEIACIKAEIAADSCARSYFSNAI